MHTNRNSKKRGVHARGFSLVELMVSITIFAIVTVVSMSTLLVMIDANAKSQALYQAMTNVSFLVDSMTRNIRTAHEHYCGSANLVDSLPAGTQDCNAGTGIVFTRERDNIRTGYRLNTDEPNDQFIEQKENGGTWIRLTSRDVFIETLTFSVDGTAPLYGASPNDSQPRVSVLIRGYVRNGLDNETSFTLQTTVVPRILDY